MAQSHEYERIILGVDPGTNVMGYGIVGIHGKTASLIALGVIRLSKSRVITKGLAISIGEYQGLLIHTGLMNWPSRLRSSGKMCSRC